MQSISHLSFQPYSHIGGSFKPDENGAWKFLLAKELKEVEY